ncbi:MAG: hypothetical protein ABSG25_11215 [Bryobacteraceae bacterium]
MTAALTLPNLRRTLAAAMIAGYDAAFARMNEHVAVFWANEKFWLSYEK